MTDQHLPLLTVIVPCYNEAAVLPTTHAHLARVLEGLDLRYEILYVDDGSSDATPLILRELQGRHSNVRVLYLARNFGQQIASSAGLEYAEGDAVVLIDADLQDPPEVIRDMVEEWRKGNEVVFGQRIRREGETHFKSWTAKIFYRLINLVSEVPIPVDTGDFRLMDQKVVQAINQMPERDRFLRGMISWAGFRQISVRYERKPRRAGQDHYSVTKMIRLAIDGVVSFSFGPLRLASYLGALILLAGLGGAAYAGFQYLQGHSLSGWWLPALVTCLMTGLQLICLGIVGEYLGRVYREAQRRPLYTLRGRLGFKDQGTLIDSRPQPARKPDRTFTIG